MRGARADAANESFGVRVHLPIPDREASVTSRDSSTRPDDTLVRFDLNKAIEHVEVAFPLHQ